MKTRFFLALFIFSLCPFLVAAQSFQDGMDRFSDDDLDGARSIFEPLAFEEGDADAMFMFAHISMIELMDRLPPDLAEMGALPFFDQAAKAGQPNAQARMCIAMMPQDYQDDPQDPAVAEALSWCILADRGGVTQDNLQYFSRRLPDSVMDDAVSLADAFIPRRLPKN